MTPALFGILQLDRGEPLGYANVVGLVQAWLQDAGGFAAVGLVLYLLYAWLGLRPTVVLAQVAVGSVAGRAAGRMAGDAMNRAAGDAYSQPSESNRLRLPITTWMVSMAALSLIGYAVFAALWITGRGGVPVPPPPLPGTPVRVPPPVWHGEWQPLVLMVAGLFALLGIGEPFARDLLKVRFRRVWALSKLGFKEAVRSRLLWLGLLILPVFLFRNVWMAGVRPVDEFRTLVTVSAAGIMVLVLFTAVLLASFSIPNDIKNLTIHTVVTKPVERFEIVLGRFFGYTALMTVALVALTALSLLLINTATIDPKAEAEAAKARVPVRGRLEFKSRKTDFEGTNVGREFEYRKYIAGHPESPQRGIWHFAGVPSSLTRPPGDAVPVEYTFDVFKLTKGDENRGVGVTFRAATYQCPQVPPRPEQRGDWQWADQTPGADGKTPEQRYKDAVEAYRKQGINPDTARPGTEAWKAVNDLAERFGFYELRGTEVMDYAVGGVVIPAGLFRNAAQGTPDPVTGPDGTSRPGPRLSLYVKCESPGQLLGMAEPDLYLLEQNQPFTVNFVKGMVGLWCQLCILTGLAVACSTYLSGVLSLLAAGLIYLGGYATDHLTDLALGRSVGGGPFESMSRLVRAEQPTAPLTESAGTQVLQFFDRRFAWLARRVQNVVPDVESFTWTNFVSEGFNVSTEYLVVNLLVMAGYLLPWGVLAYYLMKSREVAS